MKMIFLFFLLILLLSLSYTLSCIYLRIEAKDCNLSVELHYEGTMSGVFIGTAMVGVATLQLLPSYA